MCVGWIDRATNCCRFRFRKTLRLVCDAVCDTVRQRSRTADGLAFVVPPRVLEQQLCDRDAYLVAPADRCW
jgi:hypothetical protein